MAYGGLGCDNMSMMIFRPNFNIEDMPGSSAPPSASPSASSNSASDDRVKAEVKEEIIHDMGFGEPA